MEKVNIAIAGGSGYAGGELLRLLLSHPHANVQQVTSERFDTKPVTRTHPNLRKRTSLKFCSQAELQPCEVLFSCLPHGSAEKQMDRFKSLAGKVIDLSSDFRLNNRDGFVYGIPVQDFLTRVGILSSDASRLVWARLRSTVGHRNVKFFAQHSDRKLKNGQFKSLQCIR